MESMYFVAVVLPKHLDEKILQHKKWMKENYGCKVGLKSPAHVTLVPPFWMNAENESQLKNNLKTIASAVVPFTVWTNNFAAFKPRTLFVATKENKALNELKKKTDDVFQRSDYKIKKEARPFHPHITIATRDLHKAAFAGAWPQFQNKSFEESFAATSISLLKHNGRTWDVIFTANFKTDLEQNAGKTV
ncbi:RNA 2',3'-cyclic phosphodiesterase [Flavisolibacter ginsenosidimutans]|uniref:RNA 2',3'-cyclic phosphodiesterase n=1 Tax=Flavisolibacter ginsenosidimutans TaxID=661481 RepID=A0A5B8UIB5_9BACT|nr:RNA 2',3'-cyclic phosphodiesterase [Flavisolibacter ginsenosidimutans]QEC56411.1 RNA 2',3'-cyclic phosphodiesterase [Flavisolibacter ginsenosidimutans]